MNPGCYRDWILWAAEIRRLFTACSFDMYPRQPLGDGLFYHICLRARLEMCLINAAANPRRWIWGDDDASVQRCVASSVFQASDVYTLIYWIDFFSFYVLGNLLPDSLTPDWQDVAARHVFLGIFTLLIV